MLVSLPDFILMGLTEVPLVKVKYTDSGSITIEYGELVDDPAGEAAGVAAATVRKDSIRIGISV
jgi:hypothetical protein